MPELFMPTPAPLAPLPETAAIAGHGGSADKPAGLRVESVSNSPQGAAQKHWRPQLRERMQACRHRFSCAMHALKKNILRCVQPGSQENSAVSPGSTGKGTRQTKPDKSKFFHLHRKEATSIPEIFRRMKRKQLIKDYEKKVAPRTIVASKTIEGYQFLGYRGEGGYGVAHTVVKGPSGKMMVAKAVHQRAFNMRPESYTLEKLNHPNIVQKRGDLPRDKGFSINSKSMFYKGEDKVAVDTKDYDGHFLLNDAGQPLKALIESMPYRPDAPSDEEQDDPTLNKESYWSREKEKTVTLHFHPVQYTGKLLTFSPLPVPLVQDIIRQLADALDYLHNQHNMSHGDFHSGNILIKPDGHATLIDFGSTIEKSANPKNIRALGRLLYELVCSHRLSSRRPTLAGPCPTEPSSTDLSPFPEEARAAMQARDWDTMVDFTVENQIDNLQKQKASGLSPEKAAQLKELLTGMLRSYRRKRMTFKQILEHPFLRKDDAPTQTA